MPAKRASAGRLLRARQAFATTADGQTVVIQPGAIVQLDDPIVKGREALFEDFDEWVANNVRKFPGQRVEQATAAPGEKRG